MSEVDNLRQRLADATGDAPTQPLPVKAAGMFKLTAGEVRKACERCPSHKHAPIFLKAVEQFPDAKEVMVERVDLEAMLDGLDVTVERNVVDDPNNPGKKMTVETKRVVPAVKTGQPTSPKKKTPDAPDK